MSKKSIILFTVFVDILGFGIIIPVLPFYVMSFGAKEQMVTLLFSAFSFFAFFSAPFLGALSDKIGRRPVLIASILSTCVGWFVFALAKNIPMLFIGRIIDGLAAGNISTAQSYLSDISKSEKERTENLGLIGAIFGVGFIIGPMIGGFLGSISHSFPFLFAGFLSAVNVILAIVFLPETLEKKDRKKERINYNPFLNIYFSLKEKKFRWGLLVWFLFGFTASVQQSVFALYLFKAFGYKEFVSSVFLVLIGLILALNQGVFLKRFWIKRFKEPDLEFAMFFVLSFGFLLMSFHYLPIFVLGILALVLGQSVLRVVMTSQMAGVAGKRRGEILGTMSSLMSLSMIIGPIMAGWLFGLAISFPFIFCSVISLIAPIFILYCRKSMLYVKLKEDVFPPIAI